MPTANEEIFDAVLRHQAQLTRLEKRELRMVVDLLRRSDNELVAMLRSRLARIRQRDVTLDRFRELLRNVRTMRAETMRELRERVRQELRGLAKVERDAEVRILQAASPVELELAQVTTQQVWSAAVTKPFASGRNEARTLTQWFQSLEVADRARVRGALQLGVSLGEDIDTIVRRIAGTSAENFTDGALAVTRRNAQTIVRTGVNHISNVARESVWEENGDLIRLLRWTSTLDGRTSAVCRARDGRFAPMDPEQGVPEQLPALVPHTARPPAHPNCRSTTVPILDPEGLAQQLPTRPFVADARTRRAREIDFRADAKRELGAERWRRMDRTQRNQAIRRQRLAWTEGYVGQVPGETNYGEWLKRQPKAFQEDVLGVTKARLFRRGDLPMDKFVDMRGVELTLDELADQNPAAFVKAGLDPARF